MATGRERIEILEKKAGIVWIIVCDLEPTVVDGETCPRYSHHWTGRSWQSSDKDGAQIYTQRSTAEVYLKEDLRVMLRKLPAQ